MLTRQRAAALVAALLTLVALAAPSCAPSRRAPDLTPVAAAGGSAAPRADSVAWTPAACLAGSADADADGVDDGCEQWLAATFAPLLVVSGGGCDWDRSVAPARLGGEYLFAVERAGSAGRITIAYLPAYYLDCGWEGAKCLLTRRMCEGHAGDSEAVMVGVAFDADRGGWYADGVFLSSHCYGRSGGGCRWYRGAELERFVWVDGRLRGAPVVWVARGTHANYPTRRACDRGHWGYDTCDGNATAYRFPVMSVRQNAGSRVRPFFRADAGADCIGPAHAGWRSAMPAAGAVECLWRTDGHFRGWQRTSAGDAPTPYGRYLRDFAGM